MDRKEFLSMLGLSAGGLLLATCMGGCKKSADAPANVNFTLDLSQPANASLSSAGGFVYSNGVIVAKTNSGSIIAVSAACTHEGTSVQYQAASSRFHCPNHGANFTETGTVINGPASTNLKQYTVNVNGNIITVTG